MGTRACAGTTNSNIVRLPAVCAAWRRNRLRFHFSTSSTFRLSLLRPVPLHLRQPLHVDGRLLAFVLSRQALEQLDGVRQIVIDRLPCCLEVDATDLGERCGGIGRALHPWVGRE